MWCIRYVGQNGVLCFDRRLSVQGICCCCLVCFGLAVIKCWRSSQKVASGCSGLWCTRALQVSHDTQTPRPAHTQTHENAEMAAHDGRWSTPDVIFPTAPGGRQRRFINQSRGLTVCVLAVMAAGKASKAGCQWNKAALTHGMVGQPRRLAAPWALRELELTVKSLAFHYCPLWIFHALPLLYLGTDWLLTLHTHTQTRADMFNSN